MEQHKHELLNKGVPIPAASNVQEDNTGLSGLHNNFQDSSFCYSHPKEKRFNIQLLSFHSVEKTHVFKCSYIYICIKHFDPRIDWTN